MTDFEKVSELVRTWEPDAGDAAADAAIAERYPFLATQDVWYDDFPVDRVGTLGCIPRGWRIALGAEMFEDIRTVLLASGGERALRAYCTEQVKEKYGELRWYSSCPDGIGESAWEALCHLIELYCSICGRVCIECGKMGGVGITGPWIMPVCENEGEIICEKLPPLDPDGGFCQWGHCLPDGTMEWRSYKDECVGEDAPILKTLDLNKPLLVTDVWQRLCEGERNTKD